MKWPRWKLKHLAIAIAVLAVAFSAFGVEATVIGLFLCLPSILAPQGCRLAFLYWVAACYPLVLLSSLYLTWFTACWALGHSPRPSLNDPKGIGRIEIPYHVTFILISGIPLAMLSSLCIAVVRSAMGPAPWSGLHHLALIGIVPLVWVASYLLLDWDPLGVLNWYFD